MRKLVMLLVFGVMGQAPQAAGTDQAASKSKWGRSGVSVDEAAQSWGHLGSRTGRVDRASGKTPSARLSAWIGKDIDDVIKAWGQPKSTEAGDRGHRVYTFSDTGASSAPVQAAPPAQVAASAAAPMKFSLEFSCGVSFRVRPN